MVRSALFGVLVVVTLKLNHVEATQPHRILVDTDVDSDDVLALLYLLKQNRTESDLQVNFLIYLSPLYFNVRRASLPEVGATAGHYY